MSHNLPSFEELTTLYKESPEDFEKLRMDLIQREMDRMNLNEDKQQRIKAILWRQEYALSKIKNPTERFNRLVSKFWKQVNKFNDTLNGK